MDTNNNHTTDTTNNAGGSSRALQASPSGSGGQDQAFERFMQNLQFYPTPKELAKRMWAMFSNRDFARVLEPSAGDGALIEARPWNSEYSHHSRSIPIDCCEVDIKHHPVLRQKGASVVGIDFLAFQSGSIYSHVVMNPPFKDGARHVLKAWELLWDGEIVALLNAETLRNQFSDERRLLGQIVAEHGRVEFIENAFMVADAERKTPVCVALVHLTKKADMENDIYGGVLDGLRTDSNDDAQPEAFADDMRNELALPGDFVRLAVRSFDMAVAAMRGAVHAEARARHYIARLGHTMAQRAGTSCIDTEPSSAGWVKKELAERYDSLKDRAWASILRSTEVTGKLSSGAQSRLESEFENIKRLEFTVANIYGFLCGLVCNQGAMQIDMACDVFDLFSKYHSEGNAVYFRGWKSNDKHRTCGKRLKTTRFILPGHGRDSWSTGFGWNTERMLADVDKVFAMLDGKAAPELSLQTIARTRYADLRAGERVDSSYFSLRFFQGIGTLHFFPKDKKLVDRLNRMVGRHRAWLPNSDDQASSGFWQQFDAAEKLDKEVQQELRKTQRNRWDDPMHALNWKEGEERTKAHAALDAALCAVHERNGIPTDFQIAYKPQAAQQLPLLAA